MKAVIIGILALIIIAGGGYFIFHKSSPGTSSTSQSQTLNTTNSSSPNTITFNGSSFSPASITVKSGSTVTVKNASSQPLDFDSNPHPVHTDDTDLNAGSIAAGQSKSFTVTKTGSYGYHDHLDPAIGGKITIQ